MQPGQHLKHRFHHRDAKNTKHLLVFDKQFLCGEFFLYTWLNMTQIVWRWPWGFQAGAITFGMLDRPSSRAGARANSP